MASGERTGIGWQNVEDRRANEFNRKIGFVTRSSDASREGFPIGDGDRLTCDCPAGDGTFAQERTENGSEQYHRLVRCASVHARFLDYWKVDVRTMKRPLCVFF